MSIEKILQAMKASRTNIKFKDGKKVCEHYFGKYKKSGSHYSFKTPWQGEPWVNIQNVKGQMKPYQVNQVLQAVNKLEGEKNA
ncbi:MAG: toxin HicA [Eggerthellaceae bacterium]|nr:toxin HicA [Eggerthellaceae bacterium]